MIKIGRRTTNHGAAGFSLSLSLSLSLLCVFLTTDCTVLQLKMTLKLPSTISDLSLLAAALLLLFLPLIIKTTRGRRSSSSNEHRLPPPSPPRLPLIGNLHQLGSLPHHSLRDLSNEYGPVMLLKLGLIPTLVASSAEAAQEIMRTHDHIFATRPVASEAAKLVLRGNLDVVFAPYGEYWRQLRKICVTRLLSARMVQSFRRVREEEVASLISKISSRSTTNGDGVFNMSEMLSFFTNAIVCKAISSKYFVDETRTKTICELLEASSAIVGTPAVGDFIPALGWVDELRGLRAKARRVGCRWGRVLDEIIEGHAHPQMETMEEDNSRDDFIDVLLALEREGTSNIEFPFNREIGKSLLQDMIAGGTETSFITLDWSMAELLRNPHSMIKLQAEVRNTTGGKSAVKEEDLSKMSYLKAVIKEILRLHRPVCLTIPRESMHDCDVQGHFVPKGTRVLVNVWAIGRDPKYWEAPEEFLPERFLNNAIDFRGNDFQLIPFSAGRRICPGLQLAVSIVEIALANFVHKFDWELANGLKSEDMDMSDSPGLLTRRRESLYLVAKPFSG